MKEQVQLPQVCCPHCHLLQMYRGQPYCFHCSEPLPAVPTVVTVNNGKMRIFKTESH